MLKMRMQGTIQDNEVVLKILEQQKEARVLQISEVYADKGTKRYFRMYREIKKSWRV